MKMRDILNLVNEAAYDGGATFWYHPGTKAVIAAGSHGEEVRDNPDAFGVPMDIMMEVDEAMPYGYEDNEAEQLDEPLDYDSLPPLPKEIWTTGRGSWGRDDVYEILAQNRGWVRCGLSGPRGDYASYMSAASPKAVWLTARAFADRLGKTLEIEIMNRRKSFMAEMRGPDIASFVQCQNVAQAESMLRQ